MKRSVVLCLALALALLWVLCACGAPPAPAATPAPTPTPTPAPPTPSPEPDSEPGAVLVDKLGAVFMTLKDGDKLKLTGEDGDYYTVELDGVPLLVEKRFVRLDSLSPFEERTGYAKIGVVAYDDVYLTQRSASQPMINGAMTVISELGDLLRVRLDDGSEVFVLSAQVSDYVVSYYGGGGDSGGGGGGGGGADGANISISARRGGDAERPAIVLLTSEAQPSYPTGGTVLADGVEAYLRILSRGDAVKVTGKSGDSLSILVDGHICTVPAMLIRMDGVKAYEPTDGYAKSGALVYGNYRMTGESEALTFNAPFKVLEDLGDICYIQWEKGVGFVSSDMVGDAPAIWSYGYGGDSGGGGGGGGAEWTPPAM